jgi:predicted HTH domain antitoxin
MEKISKYFVKERDSFYREGKLEGKLESARKFVVFLIQSESYSFEKIASIADVSLDFVHQVHKELNK